jgi:hypothetical protein
MLGISASQVLSLPALVPPAAGRNAGAARLPIVLAQAQPANFKASNISGPAGKPIPLKIDMLGAGEKDSGQLFVFTGLPDGVTLHPGGNFGDFWAVNASVIDELALTAPPEFSGTFTIWITRGRKQENTAQSASITVAIGQPTTTPTAAIAVAPAPDPTPKEAAPAPTPREVTPPAPREAVTTTARPRAGGLPNEAMLITRADESFAKGDVAGARVIYEYLAIQGSSAAAMAMGETYDPLVLAKLVVKGLDADPKKAEQWYGKAEELGSQEARSRLNALAAQ